jgi:hypothetical protein
MVGFGFESQYFFFPRFFIFFSFQQVDAPNCVGDVKPRKKAIEPFYKEREQTEIEPFGNDQF